MLTLAELKEALEQVEATHFRSDGRRLICLCGAVVSDEAGRMRHDAVHNDDPDCRYVRVRDALQRAIKVFEQDLPGLPVGQEGYRFFVVDEGLEIDAARVCRIAKAVLKSEHDSFMAMFDKNPIGGACVACDMFPDTFVSKYEGAK